MRRILFAVCVFAAMVAVTNPAVAQTIDIVDYMAVTPGQWKVDREEDICSGVSEDGGRFISTYGNYILDAGYDLVSGNWISESINVLQITQNNLMWIGEYEDGISVYSPPITIPRSLGLDEPVFNSGIITTGSESEIYSSIFMITETGVSVTTPAGTFSNCIKVKWAWIEGLSGTATDILAPGVGPVKSFEAEIEEEGGLVETRSQFFEVTAYGGP